MKPLISFIIPVYNAEKTISRCVNSILAMKRNDIELILIDDGSTDNSLSVCQTEFGNNSQIKIHTQKNCGVSAARNCGIQLADGQFIMFIDSDDYIDGSALLQCMTKLDSEDKLIVFNYARVTMKQTTYTMIPQNVIDHGSLDKEAMEQLFSSHILHNIGTKIYPKKLLIDNNIQFECSIAVYEDIIFALRAIRSAKETRACSEVVYYYDIHQNSLNHSYRRNYFEAVKMLDGELLNCGYNVHFTAMVYMKNCIRAIMNELKFQEEIQQKDIIRRIFFDNRLRYCLREMSLREIKIYYRPLIGFMRYKLTGMGYLYCKLLAKFENHRGKCKCC